MKKVISLLAIGLLAFCSQAEAQFNFNDFADHPDVTAASGSFNKTTAQLKAAIAAASEATGGHSFGVSVVMPNLRLNNEGKYVKAIYYLTETIHIPAGVFLTSDSKGRRGAFLQWRDLKPGENAFLSVGGHGSGIEGLTLGLGGELIGRDDLIGLTTERGEASSCVFEDFWINMQSAGDRSIGIYCQGRESLTFRRFDIQAARPVVIGSGDNLVFAEFDLTVLPDKKGGQDDISAVFSNADNYSPANLFIGPGSGQKGDHAVHFKARRERLQGVGDTCIIQGFRWEQANFETVGPGWLFDITRAVDLSDDTDRLHGIESIMMIGCRSGQFHLQNPNYVGARVGEGTFFGGHNLQIIGGVIYGEKVGAITVDN